MYHLVNIQCVKFLAWHFYIPHNPSFPQFGEVSGDTCTLCMKIQRFTNWEGRVWTCRVWLQSSYFLISPLLQHLYFLVVNFFFLIFRKLCFIFKSTVCHPPTPSPHTHFKVKVKYKKTTPGEWTSQYDYWHLQLLYKSD